MREMKRDGDLRQAKLPGDMLARASFHNQGRDLGLVSSQAGLSRAVKDWWEK